MLASVDGARRCRAVEGRANAAGFAFEFDGGVAWAHAELGFCGGLCEYGVDYV